MSQQPSPEGGHNIPLNLSSPRSLQPVQRSYATTAPAQHCAYCNAPLDPFYYFCLRCSTPYKQVEAITGMARPMPLTDGQRIKRMAPHTWTVFWTYAWVIIGCIILSLIWGPMGGSELLLEFIGTLAIFITTVIFTCIHWRPLVAQLKNPGFHKWEAWAGLGLLIPLLLMSFGIHILTKYGFNARQDNPLNEMPLPVAILLFCFFPAVTEEIAFRGLIQYWLETAITPVKAILLGSAMFAGLHLRITFPYLFLVGALLALVRRRTGSLYPGMLIHFLHNLVVIAVFPLF